MDVFLFHEMTPVIDCPGTVSEILPPGPDQHHPASPEGIVSAEKGIETIRATVKGRVQHGTVVDFLPFQ